MAYGKIKADAIIYDNSGSDVEKTIASLASAAPLADPTFTGTPAAPTASVGTNTTQIATTAFVNAELSGATTPLMPKAGGTFTGDVTYNEAISIERVKEKITLQSTPQITGAQNFDLKTSAIFYANLNATGNYSINLRGDSSTTLTSILGVNESITCVFIVSYGSTAYYPTAITIDGSAPQTLRWVGGAPSSAGTANSICATTISVLKTAASTFTVLASQAEYEA